MTRKLIFTFGMVLLCFSVLKVGYAQEDLGETGEADIQSQSGSGNIVVDTSATIDLGEAELDDFGETDDLGEDDAAVVDDANTQNDGTTSTGNTSGSTSDETISDVTVNPNQPTTTTTTTDTSNADDQEEESQDGVDDISNPIVDDANISIALSGRILGLCGGAVFVVVALAI